MKMFIVYLAIFCSANFAQAQSAVSSFNCMSLYWSPSGGASDKDILVSYRKVSDATWSEGLNMRYNPIAGTTLEKGDYRGSVVNLAPATLYEFKLVLQGTSTITTITKATWSENFPVGSITNVGSQTTAYNITLGGTASGYKVYDGQNNTIDVKHVEQYCIKVTQPYVIIRNFVLKGAGSGVGGSGGYIGAIIINDGVHDVVIEGCDISDFGRAHPNPLCYNHGYGRDAGIQMFGENIARIIVQRNKIHHPAFTTNCSFPFHDFVYVHGDGPDGIHMANTIGNHVFRFNEIYSDTAHMFNYCFEGLNNGSYKGGSGADTEFYGNYLSHNWGNTVESEGGNQNTRIWNNYMTISSQHIGNAPVSIGPMYIWRNVFEESEWWWNGRAGGSVIKMGYADSESWMTGNIYVFNNTVLQNGKGAGDGIGGQRIVKHTILRNNINQTRTTDRPAFATTNNTSEASFDYDLYNGVQSADSNMELNGIKGVPTYVEGAGYNETAKTGNFQLTTNSLGYDKGVVIKNFSDAYTGSAPDIGAHENGWPNFIYGLKGTYGPASENTDVSKPTTPTNVIASNIESRTCTLSWTAGTDNVAVADYEIINGTTTIGISTATNMNVVGLTCNAINLITIKARDAAGNFSGASAAVEVKTTAVCPIEGYRIIKAKTAPTIDGNIAEFNSADSISFEIPSRASVVAKVLWDSTALYIAACVTETQLNATLTTRDKIWGDDALEIFIDNNHDKGGSLNADDYQVSLNTLNVQMDIGAGKSVAWNGKWQSAIILNGTNNDNTDIDKGYTMEIAIPWAIMGYASTPNGGKIIGLDFAIDDKNATDLKYIMWPSINGGFQTPGIWQQAYLAIE